MPDKTMPDKTIPDKKIRLLIAEDAKSTRNLLFAALDATSYSIDFAINGFEAVDLFLERLYDVIITDLQMPLVDGLSVARKIRKIEDETRRGRTPIIALTAGAAKISRETCFAAGMNAYLSKPIDLPLLTSTIKELNDGRHVSPPRLRSRDKGNSTMDSSKTLNIDEALARLQGNQELYRSMAEFFIEDHSGLMAQIKTGMQNQDPEGIAQAAHALKGMSASVGGEMVVTISNEVEGLAKTGRSTDITPLLPKLESEIAKLLRELSHHTL